MMLKDASILSNGLNTQPFYHGTKADLKPGDLIELAFPCRLRRTDGFVEYFYWLDGTKTQEKSGLLKFIDLRANNSLTNS
jgi:hypothetical protein